MGGYRTFPKGHRTSRQPTGHARIGKLVGFSGRICEAGCQNAKPGLECPRRAVGAARPRPRRKTMSTVMKALVLRGHGDLDVLRVEKDYPKPSPGPGEVKEAAKSLTENPAGSARRCFLRLGASETCHDVPASWRRLLLPRPKNPSPALRRQGFQSASKADPGRRARRAEWSPPQCRQRGRPEYMAQSLPTHGCRLGGWDGHDAGRLRDYRRQGAAPAQRGWPQSDCRPRYSL